MREYDSLVSDLKALQQENVTLPMAEDEWYTRPDTVSYGIVSIDFEAGQLNGDGVKLDKCYEGSVDLYSLTRSGAGWIDLITAALTSHCGASWSLNSHMYERDTGLFHWEWTFQIEDTEIPEPEPEPEPEG